MWISSFSNDNKAPLPPFLHVIYCRILIGHYIIIRHKSRYFELCHVFNVDLLNCAWRYFETVGIMNVGIMKVGILETLLRGVREQMMRGKHSKRVHIEYIHSSIVIR